MKKFRKLLSLVLAMVMVLAMAAPSFAAETGTITITNATVGKSYSIYKIFDANPSGTEDGPVAYTATAEQKMWFESQDNNPFTFTANSAGTYNVSVNSSSSNEDVITFLQGFVTDEDGVITVTGGFDTVASLTDTEVAESETVEFSNVPYGYYLITSSLGAVVSVDSTNKDATIIDKNQGGPSWGDGGKTILSGDDEVSEISVNYGDTVDFQIKFDTTNYNGAKKITEYYVSDQLDDGMSYVLDEDNKLDVTVTVGTQELIESDEYTVAMDSDGQGFTITVPWYVEDAFLYASPSYITVTYSATVDTDAEIAGDGMKNKATFSYKDENGNTDHESTEKETTTYTYALGIYKSDKTGTPLEGATFELTKNNDPVYVVATETSGVYMFDTSDSTSKSNVVVSPADGIIEIKGVAAGTYTVTETSAPEGYNILPGAVTITAQMDSSTTYYDTNTIYYDDEGNVTETETETWRVVETTVPVALTAVVNYAGTLLPSTGGIGTTIFYAAGIILMAGAVFFVVRRKRA